MGILSQADLYALKLSRLNLGHAYYEPNPHGSFDFVRVGDVGFMLDDLGKFVKLFNAFNPPDTLENTHDHSCFPNEFEPIAEPHRQCTQLDSLSPGCRGSENIRIINDSVPISGSADELNTSRKVEISCLSICGAAIITKFEATRCAALSIQEMRDYMLDNCFSWLRLSQEEGLGTQLHDLMIVTETVLTGDWETKIWKTADWDTGYNSSTVTEMPNGGDIEFPFQERSWQHAQVPDRTGPYRGSPPDGVTLNFDQCIFLKGMRVADREWYKEVTKAAKITRILKEIGTRKEMDAEECYEKVDEVFKIMAGEESNEGDSPAQSVLKLVMDVEFELEFIDNPRILSTKAVKNTEDVLMLYIFENCDADLALIEDDYAHALGLYDADSLADVCDILLGLGPDGPVITVFMYGTKKVARLLLTKKHTS